MTRINTNVSSLIAQKNLSRSNDNLQEALTRLSTGLRINTGKDDPAGLIASESLRSNIVSVQKGISNSQTANQLISTADSALGQVSSLLNDIRSLVVESASSGGLSADQVAANQLQVDSSLGAIDRIAQTTQFQGRRLLDGSLDFLTTSSNASSIQAAGTIGATADANAKTLITGSTGKIDVVAQNGGAANNGYAIKLVSGAAAGSETAAVDNVAKTVTVSVSSASSTAAQIVTALNANGSFNANFSASVNTAGTVGSVAASTTSAGVNGNQFNLQAKTAGANFNGASVAFVSGAATGSETAAYDSTTKTLTIHKNDNSTKAQILSAINAEGTFSASTIGSTAATYSTNPTATLAGGLDGFDSVKDLKINQANFGTASSIAVNVNVDTQAAQGQLTYSGGALTSDLVLEIGGKKGFNVLNFGSGSSISTIKDAINQNSDATGVSASVSGANLVLKSQDYGTNSFVSARALSGTFNVVNSSAAQVTRSTGTDVSLRINGVKAVGDGLKASLNSPTLDLAFSLSSNVGNNASLAFTITGGGANFQLGPEVVSNQQARLGIQGVGTATLGGVSGKLYELKSGGSKSLTKDVTGAANVVTEVINSVTSLRGRLGAFQKTTVQTNINSLSDTLSNLTQADSNIRDADFAAETAKLTQSQILVQAGTSVLQISNQRPQAVLSLLQR
jgi:flagellin